MLHSTLELKIVAVIFEDRPCFLKRDQLHALKQLVRNFRPTIRQTLIFIERRQSDHILGAPNRMQTSKAYFCASITASIH